MDTNTRLQFVVSKEHKIEDQTHVKNYIFDVPYGAPTGEAYDACIEILSQLKNILVQQAEKKEKEAKQNDPVEIKVDNASD